MDALVRVKLRPIGVWSTPWQADTLLGSLANTWGRTYGIDALKRDFLEPWLENSPLFVISDAFAGDWLPAPAVLPLWAWNQDEESTLGNLEPKAVKKLQWLNQKEFSEVQHGRLPTIDEPDRIWERQGIIFSDNRTRNAISRATDTTGEGGELFQIPISSIEDSALGLTLYARVADGAMDVLLSALQLLGRTGYGANASVGHGGFEIDGEPSPCPELDDATEGNGFISLSTFQPAADDPVEGYWRTFVKYGKLAPELQNIAVFKRPQVMLHAGACFSVGKKPRPFYGGPIATDRLLADGDRSALDERGIRPVQAAFALAVPMVWPKGS